MGKNSNYLYFYQPAAVIEITGEDASTFLQGQFTNDLRHPIGSATYGLWLNQKGKVLADSHVLKCGENRFLLISTTSTAAIIKPRLEQYVIADDVIISDETEKKRGLTLWGEGCGELVKAFSGGLPVPGQFVQKENSVGFHGRRTNSENYEIIGPENILAEWRKHFVDEGAADMADEGAELARVVAGIPAIPQDIGPTDLPNEAGLEESAISFTKGCYLGQEVMARLKNLGQVRRSLRIVYGNGTAPKAGTPLFQAMKKVGEVRSAVSSERGFIALAMLMRMGLEEKAGFNYEPAEQSAQNAVVWMS